MAPRARLMDPGAMLATTHELDEGTRVRLRLARPSDVPMVRAFFGDGPAEADALVRRFPFYDPRERVVLAATMLDAGFERIVALGDAAFDDLPEVVGDQEIEDRGLDDLMGDAGASYTRLHAPRRPEARPPGPPPPAPGRPGPAPAPPPAAGRRSPRPGATPLPSRSETR